MLARLAVCADGLGSAAYQRAQMSISVALPYFGLIVAAEHGLHASGVIAVVAAGMSLNLLGPGRIPPTAWAKHARDLGPAGALGGGDDLHSGRAADPATAGIGQARDFGLIVVVIAAAMAARAIVLFGLLPLLTALRVSPPVERRYRAAILWGGLRGAVTLALALAVTESFQGTGRSEADRRHPRHRLHPVHASGAGHEPALGDPAAGAGPAVADRSALSNQVVAVALQSVREERGATVERILP